jgi:hypothetical protein
MHKQPKVFKSCGMELGLALRSSLQLPADSFRGAKEMDIAILQLLTAGKALKNFLAHFLGDFVTEYRRDGKCLHQ